MREGVIVRSGRPRSSPARARDRDPLPPRRRGGRRAHERADARPARADRGGARARRASSRGSRCAGRRSKRSTCRYRARRRGGRRASACFVHELRAQQLAVLAEPRGRALHVPLAGAASSCSSARSTASDDRGRRLPGRGAVPAGGDDRLRRRPTAFAGLAITLVIRRESGILKRRTRDAAAAA